MTQAAQPPEPLENRVANLELNMLDLRTAAEFLLQTAQAHQADFETIAAEMRTFRRLHEESNQRFEIMLAESRQAKIESDARFAENDKRFAEMKAESDKRFAESDRRFAESDKRFAENDARFQQMQANINRMQEHLDRVLDRLFPEPGSNTNS